MWLALALAGASPLALAEAPWDVVKGDHFLVYHRGDAEGARNVSRRAEDHYRRIRHDLGFAKYDDFWVWDRRVRIYVYPSHRFFVRATGAPGWAAGKASYDRREISTFRGNDSFLDSVLAHELTHLIFVDFLGFQSTEVPLWLHEGMAQWEEPGRRAGAHSLCRRLLAGNRLFPLAELTRLDVHAVKRGRRTAAFYAQSASLVGYLIEQHGSVPFRKLCGQLRDGKRLDDALRFTYPGTIRTLEALETAWRTYLEAGQ